MRQPALDAAVSGRVTAASFSVGVKVYSFDWFVDYGVDYDAVAGLLRDFGVSFVVAQSRYLPMADSAVSSAITSPAAARFSRYQDEAFVDALRRRGTAYWAACNMFFDPEMLARYPDAVPVDHRGHRAQPLDWYVGTCPTHAGYVDEKIGRIETAAEALRPDGLFLGFTRFPGFWELWLPHTRRGDWPEYCFCPRCLTGFQQAQGVEIPTPDTRGEPTAQAAAWIREHAYREFVDWKGNVIADVVRKVRRRLGPLPIMLNTLPFGRTDFDGAGAQVFGQDWARLDGPVDVFEVMAYHQVLGRDVDWIARVVSEVRAGTRGRVMATVQVDPLYVTGMHAGAGRKPTLPLEEFTASIDAARDAGADGTVIFTWSDLLRHHLRDNDPRYAAVLRAAAKA